MFDQEGSTARRFIYSAVFWLIIPITYGLLLALHLWKPDLIFPWLNPLHLSFGRLRPMHVNTAAFGWLSMAQLGAMFYIVPRLTGVKLYSERLGNWTMVIWNVAILIGNITLGLGMTQGREYAEYIWPIDLGVMLLLAMAGYNLFKTVGSRREKQLYVSLWYFLGTFTWFPVVYFIGNLMWITPFNAPLTAPWGGALLGVNDAIVNWFYGHNVVGLWFTTLGIGAMYYLVPKLTGNPLYSHRLSLIGFWTIAFTYIWTGTHHLVWGPVPKWTQMLAITFSVMMIIPVWTVVWNFVKTMEGKWNLILDNIPLRFLALGSITYFLVCLQGPLQSLRSVSITTHFTNWVPGHAHLALLATFSYVAFAAIYEFLPRLVGRPIYSKTLMNWHFWLVFIGFVFFFTGFTVGGLVQGISWNLGKPFLDVVKSIEPWSFLRAIGAVSMFAGLYVFGYNVLRTAMKPRPQPQPRPAMAGSSLGGAQ